MTQTQPEWVNGDRAWWDHGDVWGTPASQRCYEPGELPEDSSENSGRSKKGELVEKMKGFGVIYLGEERAEGGFQKDFKYKASCRTSFLRVE